MSGIEGRSGMSGVYGRTDDSAGGHYLRGGSYYCGSGGNNRGRDNRGGDNSGIFTDNSVEPVDVIGGVVDGALGAVGVEQRVLAGHGAADAGLVLALEVAGVGVGHLVREAAGVGVYSRHWHH